MLQVLKRTALGLLAAVLASTAGSAQSYLIKLGALYYKWPSVHASGVLLNDGSGNLSWSPSGTGASMPSGIIVYTTDANCPAGYSEYTGAQGRYPIITPNTGYQTYHIGTALSAAENRATGQHNHSGSAIVTLNDAQHSHSVTDPGHDHSGDVGGTAQIGSRFGGYAGDEYNNDSGTTGSSGTGISISSTSPSASASVSATVDNSGSTAGTNAPYVQLKFCQKS